MAYQENTGGVSTTTPIVVGLFKNASDAHTAVTQLRANGFTSDQIGAAFRSANFDRFQDRAVAGDAGLTPQHESWWEKIKDAFRPEDEKSTSTAAEMDANNYARSEYEYDYASDDFEGSLAAAGISAQRAAYLTRSLEAGGAIVTVRDANRASEAERILAANDARVRYEDADATDNSYTGTGAAGLTPAAIPVADPFAPAGTLATDAALTDNVAPDTPTGQGMDRVQLFGEVLRVHKERISRGEVRVHKDVVTENQAIEVPVTREEFVLERVPVSGTTPVSSANIGRDQEIRIPLSEETVRVEKQPVVQEEVAVGKREVSEVATLNDTVRHEELRVDDESGTPRRAVTGEDLAAEDVRRRG